MQLGIRGVAFTQLASFLSIASTIFLTGCSAFSGPHADDWPVNYRRQIADYIRTERFPLGSKKGAAEIADPHKAPLGAAGYNVCVRFGGGGYPNFSTVMVYGFIDGQLVPGTGKIASQFGQGALTEALACGANPNFKPFPEAEFQPPSQTKPQPRT